MPGSSGALCPPAIAPFLLDPSSVMGTGASGSLRGQALVGGKQSASLSCVRSKPKFGLSSDSQTVAGPSLLEYCPLSHLDDDDRDHSFQIGAKVIAV